MQVTPDSTLEVFRHYFEDLVCDHLKLFELLTTKDTLFCLYRKFTYDSPITHFDQAICTLGSLSKGWGITIGSNSSTVSYIPRSDTSAKNFKARMLSYLHSSVPRDVDFHSARETEKDFYIGYPSLIIYFMFDDKFKDIRVEKEEYKKVLNDLLACILESFIESDIPDIIKSYWLELNIREFSKDVQLPEGLAEMVLKDTEMNDPCLSEETLRSLSNILSSFILDTINSL